MSSGFRRANFDPLGAGAPVVLPMDRATLSEEASEVLERFLSAGAVSREPTYDEGTLYEEG